jgi:hypothetical protein
MRLLLAIMIGGCCCAAAARADDVPFAEYRYVQDLQQIQISTGYVERSPELEARGSALERHGLVMLETDTSRVLQWKEQVGTHRVETKLSIEPPVGHGEGGASSEARLELALDGNPRVDCSLRYLDRIAIDPSRGFIVLIGHDGVVRFDGFEPRKLIDDDWLAARAESIRKLIAPAPRPTR